MNSTRLSRMTMMFALLALLIGATVLTAAPINPEAHKQAYEAAKKDAEVVALVRVVAVACTESAPAPNAGAPADRPNGKAVTLQVTLQVLDVEKGPVKKNNLLVVSHKVTTAAGPGPLAYGWMAAIRRFPFTPGCQGNVALNWDKEKR